MLGGEGACCHRLVHPHQPEAAEELPGLASYYRRFVQGFSGTASPLYQLLQKDWDFVWADPCQGAAAFVAPALCPADHHP